MTRTVGFDVRPYEDTDEEAVLSLLQTSMGDGPAGPRSREFFRWKHLDNPFGRSYLILATAGTELIGLRAFMRWEFEAGGRRLRAVRAVDTATHPDWRGRGIFSRLTLAALEELAADTDFVFNTPNDKSLPGYLKMGWRFVVRLPIWVRVARPFALASHVIGREAVPTPPGEMPFLNGHLPVPAGDVRLATLRTAPYLRWRYGSESGLGYRGLRTDDGAAIYRVRRRGRLVEATVTEVFAGDPAGARRLLGAVRRAAAADHMALHTAKGTTLYHAIRHRGFVRVRGPVFVVRPLAGRIDPSPLSLGSWSLSAGDIEVF